MATCTIDAYFDYASPDAYLASEQLDELAARNDAVVDWRPIRQTRLQTPSDSGPNAMRTRNYAQLDLRRSAAYFGIPFQPPHPSQVRSESALLLALVCQEAGIFPAFHREVFRAAWANQRDIADPAVLTDCLRAAGGNAKTLMDSAKASAVKARLAALQLDADSIGLFGTPSMILEGELFWGVDRLPMLEWRLTELTRKRARRASRPA